MSTPFKLPGGYWIELEHVQGIGPTTTQMMPRHDAPPVEVRTFTVAMAFQNSPLQFNYHNLSGDGVTPLAAEEWSELCVRLEKEREALLTRWTQQNHAAHELTIDMETVTEIGIGPERQDGSNGVSITFTVDTSADGRQLVDYLRERATAMAVDTQHVTRTS